MEFDTHCRCRFLHCRTPCAKIVVVFVSVDKKFELEKGTGTGNFKNYKNSGQSFEKIVKSKKGGRGVGNVGIFEQGVGNHAQGADTPNFNEFISMIGME